MKTHTKGTRKTHVTHQLESKNVLLSWSYDVKHVILLEREYESGAQSEADVKHPEDVLKQYQRTKN